MLGWINWIKLQCDDNNFAPADHEKTYHTVLECLFLLFPRKALDGAKR